MLGILDLIVLYRSAHLHKTYFLLKEAVEEGRIQQALLGLVVQVVEVRVGPPLQEQLA